ncbi:MAG: pyridoxal phosphate-dependent decarboxylase family protein [Gaiellales bacterium]
MSTPDDIGASPLLLGGDRTSALEHGVELLREAWTSFDAPRPTQPDISSEIERLTDAPLPEHGIDPTRVLVDAAQVLDQSMTNSRPRFFAFIPSSGLEMGVLADALMAAHDVNLASDAAAANLVEHQTLQWVGELVGYPATGGTFTSGGMISNLTALATAREHALPGTRLTGTSQVMTAYTSDEAHSSIERAVELIGIGRDNLRRVPIDADRRMDPAALDAMLGADRSAGRVPMAVVATAGTTLTGTVDPIDAIAEVCERHDVWLHIDGAYGLPAAAAPSTAPLFRGLARANSVAVDAHKWLYVPKACGVLLVRDKADLVTAFAHDAAYMIDEDLRHPVDWTLEYSRPFRALKLWVALRTHGAAAFRAAIDRNVHLARLLARRVSETPNLQLLKEPDLTVVAFRHLPAVGDLDMHNRALAHAIQVDGRVYLAPAVIDGHTYLRPCITNFRTNPADVEELLTVVLELGAAVEAKHA